LSDSAAAFCDGGGVFVFKMESGSIKNLHDTLKNIVLKTTIYGEDVKSHGMLAGYEKFDWISDNNNSNVRNMACSKRLPNHSRRN
jgi:hypothetical protein